MIVCDDIDHLLIDYAEGTLSEAKAKEVEKHIQSCSACRQAWEQYKILFNVMENNAPQQPSPMLFEKFQQMLLTEGEIEMTSLHAKTETKTKSATILPLWIRIAASIILLAGGILIGMRINTPAKDNDAALIANLNQEVREMKEVLTVTLLNNESASERIKAVNYTENISQPDEKIMQALIHTVNTDNNVNVRLAALYALDKFSSSQQVRDSLVSALYSQKEPVIQIVLINILAEKKEIKAIAPIRKILSDKHSLQSVKEIAQKGLRII